MANPFLLAGAALSAVAALLHMGCIFFGASWYRFFGAGERMTRLAAAGDIRPALITTGIVAVLILWSLFALSGAGVVPRVPLLRVALGAITGIYLVRGVMGMVFAVAAPGTHGATFWWWSSAICLGIGALHLVGTQQVWASLARAAA